MQSSPEKTPIYYQEGILNELFTRADFCEKDLGMKDPEKLKKLPQGISLEASFPVEKWNTRDAAFCEIDTRRLPRQKSSALCFQRYFG